MTLALSPNWIAWADVFDGEACLLEGDLDPVPAQKMVGPEGEKVSLRLLLHQMNHLRDPLLVSPATFSSFSNMCADRDSIAMHRTANFEKH